MCAVLTQDEFLTAAPGITLLVESTVYQRGIRRRPENEVLDCAPRDGNACVLSSVRSAVACLVTPLCNEQCERCDPEGCASLCGNPFANGDETVNTTDAVFALPAAVELEECSLCVCDVDGDGAVTLQTIP